MLETLYYLFENVNHMFDRCPVCDEDLEYYVHSLASASLACKISEHVFFLGQNDSITYLRFLYSSSTQHQVFTYNFPNEVLIAPGYFFVNDNGNDFEFQKEFNSPKEFIDFCMAWHRRELPELMFI
jgi:hypothetical protein